jgi:hypothetical protein
MMLENEFVQRVFTVILPLSRYVYIVAATLAVACIIVIPLCRRTWLNKPSFSWLGVFYYQTSVGYLRLTCAWLKLVLLIALLFQRRPLEAAEYMLLLIPGVLYSLLSRNVATVINKLLWVAIGAVSVFVANTISSYITEMDPGVEFTIIYILFSVYAGVFALYLFLRDLHAISGERRRSIG